MRVAFVLVARSRPLGLIAWRCHGDVAKPLGKRHSRNSVSLIDRPSKNVECLPASAQTLRPDDGPRSPQVCDSPVSRSTT